MSYRKFTCILLNLMAFYGGQVSLAEAQNKDDYTLFNPTPQEHMREFVTDRPDKTESPITVDAGHYQHETDLLNVIIDQADGATDVSYLAVAPNAKVGLTNDIDLQ